jgi:hypothetical protein
MAANRLALVFVAGPYRAPSEREVVLNIQRAEELALRVWKSGAACLCSHKNTALFGGAAPDTVWLDGALEMLRRCDAVVCVDGWRNSEGAVGEVSLAKELGIPVFEDFGEFRQWLVSQRPRAG